MRSDSKGALQQGGTHPLETTMESSSFTPNFDKRAKDTENLLKKNEAELDMAYASTIDYIRNCAKKQKEREFENEQQIKLKIEKDEDDRRAQIDYNETERKIELKNQELDDEQKKKLAAEELNRKIKELEEMIAFLNEKIKDLEERHQANINDFKENAYQFFNEYIEQFINEIITDEKHELYAHRHDLRQHIINHLKSDMLSNLNKDNFPKNLASEITKEILNAYRSFMKSNKLEHILHKFEKAFEKLAQKVTDAFTQKHHKQLAVLHEERQAIAIHKELRDKHLQEVNLWKDKKKINEESVSKQISTKQQPQDKREPLHSFKRSASSIDTSEKDVAKLTIKRQGMRERFAQAQRASTPTTSPSPTSKSERSSIQKNPSTQKRQLPQERQPSQEDQSISISRRRGGR